MMKETVTSIRGWFGLMGVVNLLNGITHLVLFSQDIVEVVFASVLLCFGIGFIYSAAKFPEFVKTSTRFVQYLLYISAGFGVLTFMILLVLGTPGLDLLSPAIGIMILWYLLLNVKRLEEEHGLHEFED